MKNSKQIAGDHIDTPFTDHKEGKKELQNDIDNLIIHWLHARDTQWIDMLYRKQRVMSYEDELDQREFVEAVRVNKVEFLQELGNVVKLVKK